VLLIPEMQWKANHEGCWAWFLKLWLVLIEKLEAIRQDTYTQRTSLCLPTTKTPHDSL
jgi:hypothetical protein